MKDQDSSYCRYSLLIRISDLNRESKTMFQAEIKTNILEQNRVGTSSICTMQKTKAVQDLH